jgi:hypothetical protein
VQEPLLVSGLRGLGLWCRTWESGFEFEACVAPMNWDGGQAGCVALVVLRCNDVGRTERTCVQLSVLLLRHGLKGEHQRGCVLVLVRQSDLQPAAAPQGACGALLQSMHS